MDCSLPGSSIYGLFQARILEWIAISFYRGSSCPRDRPRSPALQAVSLLSEPLSMWATNTRTFTIRDENYSGYNKTYISVQFSSVAQSCPTLCDPMNRSMVSFPVHHQLPEFTQTHIHWVGDAIQPSRPLLSSSLPAFNFSLHKGLFKWLCSLHQVAKVLEFQHRSFQWILRTDFL